MNQEKYVLAQIFEMVNRYEFNRCIDKYNGNYRVKSFSCWEQFVVMSFAQFSFRESLRDIECCLGCMQKKLYRCGIRSEIARSTLAKANKNRNWQMYADYCKVLMKAALPLYKGENALAAELKSAVYAFDSTTIDLCMTLFGWATFRTNNRAVKIHVLINTDGSIPVFVSVTTAHVQDVLLLDSIIYNSGCYYLIDKAYVDFKRLYKIELSKAFFVTRAKENMAYVVTIQNNIEGQAGVSKDELVTLQRWHTRKKYPVAIRRIEYHDTLTDLHFVFITNNMLLDATVIARLYKERWRVELFFKWIKQNLRIKKFYGTSENAVKTQIWIAVCDYLLIAILKKQLKTPLSLNQILQVLSVSLFEKCSIKDLLQKQQQTKHVSKQYELF